MAKPQMKTTHSCGPVPGCAPTAMSVSVMMPMVFSRVVRAVRERDEARGDGLAVTEAVFDVLLVELSHDEVDET